MLSCVGNLFHFCQQYQNRLTMFGGNKSSDDNKKPATVHATPGSINALAKGTSIDGNIRCESDLRVDGTIQGKLNCKSKVIIGPTGSVQGEIRCQNAVIEGRFSGILVVTELLNVRETAEVDGEISTNKLLVQSGAKFNVACKMDNGVVAGNGTAKNPVESIKAPDHASKSAEKVSSGKEEINN